MLWRYWFDSSSTQLLDCIVQMAEHNTFNVGVESSNLSTITIPLRALIKLIILAISKGKNFTINIIDFIHNL